jgi:hypothetical protein
MRQVKEAAAAGGIMPLPWLLSILRDPRETHERRFAAACAALPFCHRKLAALTISGPDDGPLQVQHTTMSITFD